MMFKNMLEKILDAILKSDNVEIDELSIFLANYYRKNESLVDKKLHELIDSPDFPKDEIRNKFFSDNKKVLK